MIGSSSVNIVFGSVTSMELERYVSAEVIFYGLIVIVSKSKLTEERGNKLY